MALLSSETTRVGLVGLSKNGWAALSHAGALLSSDKYNIVALLNSSASSARNAIQDFGLPSSTAAYGDPQDLANDSNVDLVVNSVRVHNRFPTLRPSLIAGKSVLVEGPLGKNLAEAEELLRLSKAHHVKDALVAIQGNASPVTQTLRRLLHDGRIGKILSSTFTGHVGYLEAQSLPEDWAYFLDPETGENIVTIMIGPSVAQIQTAFDDTLEISSSLLTSQIPNVTIVKEVGSTTTGIRRTHDHIMFLAKTSKGQIPLSFYVRIGTPFKGTPGLDWRIYGEKGEIRITASKATLADGLHGDETFTIHDFEKDEVVEVKLEEEYGHLGIHARNVARMYDALKSGDSTKYLTFEQAVQVQRLLDQLITSNPI